MLDQIVERFGGIDCLVNNAGIASPVRGDLLELTPENYDRVLAVNLRGTLFFTQRRRARCWRRRRAARRSIVTVSSIKRRHGGLERGDYASPRPGSPC